MALSDILTGQMGPVAPWDSPIIFETITALCFLYICKYPVGGKKPSETCSGSLVTKVLLGAFAVLCPLVHVFLLPVRLLMDRVDRQLQHTETDALLPHTILTPEMKYNAFTSCAVVACVFAAYMALLQKYDKCARAKGQINLRLEKDHESRVTFAEPEEELTNIGSCSWSVKRCIAIYGAMLVGCMVLLPIPAQNTFAYVFVERGWLRVTSDHLWVSASILFAAVMARRVWFSFNNFPAGYCKGVYAAGQFTIAYGSIICISAAVFLAFAADVMNTYAYKLMVVHHMRVLQPLAQAEDVMLGSHTNAISSKFADHLVDCTFAALTSAMAEEATLAMLMLQAMVYRAVFVQCVETLLFGCLVFAPIAMVLLVSAHGRI